MKRMLSALLILGLLAGCSAGGGQPPAPMGRYIETEGEALAGVTQLYDFRDAGDGTITFYVNRPGDGGNRYQRCVLNQSDGSVAYAEAPWLDALAAEGYFVTDLSQGLDGVAYALVMSPEGGPRRLARTPDGQSWSLVEPDGWAQAAPGEGDAVFSAVEGVSVGRSGAVMVESPSGGREPSRVQALPDGGFAAFFYEDGAVRYSAEGKELARFPGGPAFPRNIAVWGGQLLLEGTEKELWVYDLEEARQTGTYAFDSLSFDSLVGLDGDGVYLADATGIYRQAAGGSLWEKLVDGGLTSLAMPNQSLTGLAPDGAGGFWGAMSSDGSYRLVRYHYSAETPTNPDTELTIFALQDSATVRQTIGEFQRRNPNVRVNFRVAQSGDSSATTEDLIRALNTELLSGKGPDLLLLDGLPVGSYIEKGVLLDLTSLVGEWTGAMGLMENLMGAYASGGALYGVPARFSVPLSMGQREAVDSITSLEDLVARAAQAQGAEGGFLYAPEDLWGETGILMEYYDVSAGRWTQPGGGLDQGLLADYLSAVLALNGVLREHVPEMGEGSAMITVASSSGAGGFELMDMGPYALADGRARFHTADLAGMINLEQAVGCLKGLEDYGLAPLFGGGLYRPKGGVGIVAAGRQQDLARAFVELLLSETVQDKYLYDGLPVNGRSLERMVSETLEGGDDLGFTDLCRGLNTPILVDQVVKEAVQQQLKDLLSGALTPQEAAANAVESTALYRAE